MFKRPAHGSSSKIPSKFGLGCSVLFLLPFFAVGIGTFGFGLWGIYQGLASTSWTKVQGVVTHSEVEEHSDSDGTTYGAKVQYTYAWAGQKLEGNKVQTSVPVSTGGGGGARETVAHYPAGKAVEVFVNPANPKQAVLETGLGWSHLFLPLFGLGFGGVASVFLYGALWSRKKQKAAQAAALEPEAIDFGKETEAGPEGVEWEALEAASSASFRCLQLREDKNGCVRVVPTTGAWIFALLTGGIGLGIILGFGSSLWTASDKDWGLLIPVVVGSAFFMASCLMLYFMTTGPIFDAMAQRCRRLGAGNPFKKRQIREVSFSEVRGVQAMAYVHKDGEGTASTYWQLNLVLKDHARLNIMAHANQAAIESDAQALAQLLRVPLWKRV